MKFLKIRLLLILSFLSLVLVGCDVILNPYNFSDLTDEEKHLLVGDASVEELRFMSAPVVDNEDGKNIVACDLELVKTLSALYDLSKVDTSNINVVNLEIGKTKFDVYMIIEEVGDDYIFAYSCDKNSGERMAFASIFKKDKLHNFIKEIGENESLERKEEKIYFMLFYETAFRKNLDFMFNFATIERNGNLYRLRLASSPM